MSDTKKPAPETTIPADETDEQRKERRAKEFTAKFSEAFQSALNADAEEHGYDAFAPETDANARRVASQEERMRAVAARYVREECITDELLFELADAVNAEPDRNLDNADAWVELWFQRRVEREPRIARDWPVS